MDSLLNDLVNLFSVLTETERSRRAEHLVRLINAALYQFDTTIEPVTAWEDDWNELIKRIPIQPKSLSLPWLANNLASADRTGDLHLTVGRDSFRELLVTTPIEYHTDEIEKLKLEFSNPRAILDYISDLIKSAQTDLIIMSPYWSKAGVENLKRSLGHARLVCKTITILTPRDLGEREKHGCQELSRFASDTGLSFKHLVPRKLPNGTSPFVHGKVILADNRKCYIGSANISDYGLNKSIEVGVGLEGSAALNMRCWINYLIKNFESYLALSS